MKNKYFVAVVALAVVAIIGCAAMSVRLAAAQADGVSFEISLHHVAISVPNAEESAAWYKKMFGFEVILRMTQGANNGMVVVHIKRGNCYIELFQVAGAKPLPEYRRDPTADLGVHGLKHMAFQVSDVLAATKELRAKGAEIAMEPVNTPGVAFAFIRDNAGNTFELIQYKKQ
jgi:methylmalonyl-CoA/ethylmalonyl-CoA epimerase